MASKQLKLMNELYASIKQRMTKPGLDLATNRDIVENLHLAATEPEAVTYAEVDADGVPALWCIPQGSDPARVLLHSHSGEFESLVDRFARRVSTFDRQALADIRHFVDNVSLPAEEEE